MASTKSEGLTINEKSGSVGEHTSHSLSSGAMQALPASGADGDPEASVVIFTKQKEKQILRKMDLRLIPILSALYLMSFIDRTNVGNAKIEGLMDDLNLTSQQFNWCLTIFYLSYVIFEIPSNLLLKKLKPSKWLPSIMVAWGVVMTLMGIVQNFKGLFVARFFLGVAEGGLYPGIVYYITTWYRREEAQFRQALMFGSASLAGAFSGILAFGIGKMSGVAGLGGWRWIFILEGIATVLIAISAFFIIHDEPATAKFLTEEERAWVVSRLQTQGSRSDDVAVEEPEKFSWKYARQAFTDWQVLTAMFMNLGLLGPLYGISMFLPTIIRGLGYTAANAQLLTVPMYAVAAILAIPVAIWSDRLGKRSPILFLFISITALGYVIAIAGSTTNRLGAVYAGIFIAVIGIFTAFPGNIAWISNNVSCNYKRSISLAIHVGFGNLGGAMSSNFYRAQDSPQYLLGHGLSLALVLIALIAVVILRFGYQYSNKKRDENNEASSMTLSAKELGELGDRAPQFRYML